MSAWYQSDRLPRSLQLSLVSLNALLDLLLPSINIAFGEMAHPTVDGFEFAAIDGHDGLFTLASGCA